MASDAGHPSPASRGAAQGGSAAALVLVPVKCFGQAKQRLSEFLNPNQRAALARSMAGSVLAAAAPLQVAVVCDDEEVATWARSQGAAVMWTPGLGLNGALDEAVLRAAAAGAPRVTIAHADMPFAHDLARFSLEPGNRVVLVPDRHRDGTNVLSMDPASPIRLGYGPGSFQRHRRLARDAGLEVEVVIDERLAWDVDGPADLQPPPSLGVLQVEAAT